MLAVISRWISLAGGSTLLVLGTIGAVFNILIFAHPTLRKCSCSWYMFTAAIFDLLTLDHALLLRILSEGCGLDLISTHTAYCALRFYTGQITSFAPITLICLASVDRWTLTSRSVRIRRWSSIRIARYSIMITILVWSILSTPSLLVYRVINQICQSTSLTYNDYLAFFLNPVLYGLIPVVVLASFGYLTYANIHRLTNRMRRKRAKVEEQLSRAVIFHCASFILSQVPFTLWNLYLTFTRTQSKSPYRRDLETLFTQLTRLLFYFNYVSTFYINLFASKHIRKVFKFYLFLLIGRRMPIDTRVHPLIQTISGSLHPTRNRHSILRNIHH